VGAVSLFVSVYVRVHVCIACRHICMYVYSFVRRYVCLHVHVCMYRIHVYIACMHACMFVRRWVCIFFMYVYVHIYVYKSVFMYVCKLTAPKLRARAASAGQDTVSRRLYVHTQRTCTRRTPSAASDFCPSLPKT